MHSELNTWPVYEREKGRERERFRKSGGQIEQIIYESSGKHKDGEGREGGEERGRERETERGIERVRVDQVMKTVETKAACTFILAWEGLQACCTRNWRIVQGESSW